MMYENNYLKNFSSDFPAQPPPPQYKKRRKNNFDNEINKNILFSIFIHNACTCHSCQID